MKIFRYFAVIFFAVILGGSAFLNTYLASEIVKQNIEQEVFQSLEKLGIKSANVRLDHVEWGGVFRPFSLCVQAISIHDHDDNHVRRVDASNLILGVSAGALLLGQTRIKHVAARRVQVVHNDKVALSGEFELLLSRPRVAVKVNSLDVSFPGLADLNPMFAALKGIDCPVSLTIIADYNGHEITRGVIKATVGSGEIILPPYYPNKIPIQHAKFEVNLTPSKIKLTQLTVRAADAFAQLSGAVRGRSILSNLQAGQDVSLSLQGNLDRLPVDLIKVYWPHGLAKDAREWVTTNLSKGEAENATIQMKAILRVGDDPDLTIKELSGDIDAKGVDVAYLGDLPKVIDTSGHCRYTKSNFIIDAHGTCDGMEVRDAHLDISQLDQEHGHMDIDLKVDGELKPALNLISQKPLELTQKLGLDPKLFDGQAETHLKLSFPLDDDSDLNDVHVDSVSVIKNASVIHGKLGRIMEGGLLKLEATNERLDLKGTALVFRHPSEIVASKSFKSNERKLIIEGRDILHDPRFGSFSVSLLDGKLSGAVDLSKVAYDIPMALFIKEAKEPGSLRFNGFYNDDGVTLSDWVLKFGAGMAQGSAKLVAKGAQEVTIQSATAGGIQGQGKVIVQDNHFGITGTLETLDLDHVYHHYNSDEAESPYSIDADLKIEQLKLSQKLKFGQVNLRVTQSKGDLTSLKLTSEKPDVLEVFVTPEKSGVKHITLSCHNAGDVLDYFMPNSDFEGGTLNLVGQLFGESGSRVFKAEIDLRDFVVVKAPLLAQILSLSSLDGIMRTLTGQGVSFSNTVGHLEWGNDKVTLKDIHASGSSIALTLDGTINLLTDNIAIEGELYPINSLNVMLANIPLVGQVLGGGKSRGVFATAFNLTGKRQNPVISANPLSTIAPQSVKELYKQQVNNEK